MEAINNGAVAIITQTKLECDAVQVIVEDVRSAMATICLNFFNTSKRFHLIGVTGTNGKTSTTLIIKSILEKAGKVVGAITTNSVFINGKKFPTDLTTPDPIKLHSLFAKMAKAGCQYVVMEVSAHSIFLKKINGLVFDVGVFTNLSQDHLDFFKNMKNYGNVKKKFMSTNYCKSCVINADDVLGQEILKETTLPSIVYGIKNPSDVFAINLKMSLNGNSFVMNLSDEVLNIKTNLCGLFNVYNCICASATCKILDIETKYIKQGLTEILEIDGRFNKLELGQNYNLIVDYAHTPESLRNLLATVKSLTKQKITLVFGCPGNRDRDKRSKMGEIAGEFCDRVIVTSDNPSTENSLIIMKEIENGLKKTKCQYVLIDKRSEALDYAIRNTIPKSNLVVAGKGVEDYQDINTMKLPYNDFEIIKNILKRIKDEKNNQRFVY